MSRIGMLAPVLLAAVASSLAGQQPKPQTKPGVAASGVFLGRSGKPMAKARLMLGRVQNDRDWQYATVKLVPGVADAIADEKGRFQFRNVPPGTYTILYNPTGASLVIPATLSIRSLSAEDRSILPMMKNVEVGKSFEPLAERAWGQTFTLMRGHTFWSMGANMKIWNATVRWHKQGPFLEMRKGVIWLETIDEKSQIKFEAWSF